MQPLGDTTNNRNTEDTCAAEVVRTILTGMQVFRTNMRRLRPQELSVPQFRVLAFLNRMEGASLSNAAEHFGLSLASMSRTIDWLVKRGLVSRTFSDSDRRRMALGLTQDGRRIFEETRKATQEQFEEMVSHLSPDDQQVVINGARLLQGVFDKAITETRSKNGSNT